MLSIECSSALHNAASYSGRVEALEGHICNRFTIHRGLYLYVHVTVCMAPHSHAHKHNNYIAWPYLRGLPYTFDLSAIGMVISSK